jgi:hypothetical protein
MPPYGVQIIFIPVCLSSNLQMSSSYCYLYSFTTDLSFLTFLLLLNSYSVHHNFYSNSHLFGSDRTNINVHFCSISNIPLINYSHNFSYFKGFPSYMYRLSGLVVKVPGYRLKGPGSIPGATRFFLRRSGSRTGSTQPRDDN